MHSNLMLNHYNAECSACGKPFSSKGHLMEHERRHQNDFRFTCKICGKGFMSKALHKSHELKHVEVSIICVKCTVCYTLYICSSDNHDIQIRCTQLLSKEKQFKCGDCGKEYTHKKDLLNHMEEHLERQTECEVCHRSFKASSVAKHVSACKGKKFYCTLCNYNTGYKSNLNKHKKTKH